MKEIKFRGKSNILGWVYGCYAVVDGNAHIFAEDDLVEDGHHIRQKSDTPTWVDENTVGQYTGLKDANGKDIYEGDIIVVKELHDDDEDCWDNNERCPIPQVVAWDEDYKSFDFGGCYRITRSPRHFAVIGNIHDNPELLMKSVIYEFDRENERSKS